MKRTGFTSPRKPMKQVSDRRHKQHASSEGKADLAYMGEVRSGPCIICRLFGEQQLSPTTFHHTIHGRYGNTKTEAKKGIALCDGHHQGKFDTSKIALHREPDKWKAKYGLDTDYIKEQRRQIGEI